MRGVASWHHPHAHQGRGERELQPAAGAAAPRLQGQAGVHGEGRDQRRLLPHPVAELVAIGNALQNQLLHRSPQLEQGPALLRGREAAGLGGLAPPRLSPCAGRGGGPRQRRCRRRCRRWCRRGGAPAPATARAPQQARLLREQGVGVQAPGGALPALEVAADDDGAHRGDDVAGPQGGHPHPGGGGAVAAPRPALDPEDEEGLVLRAGQVQRQQRPLGAVARGRRLRAVAPLRGVVVVAAGGRVVAGGGGSKGARHPPRLDAGRGIVERRLRHHPAARVCRGTQAGRREGW